MEMHQCDRRTDMARQRLPDSDQAETRDGEAEHVAREAVGVVDAITWASALPFAVTLYLYDEGRGTS